jgi:glycosyltransferase involved in cell wall biosynthesis
LIGSSFEGHQSSYEAEVKSLIQNSEYKDNFIFTGFVQNPQYFMAACDVIVNATIHTEGFGLTLLEAMQLRKPIIAPAIGGPLEIFTHGREGFFFTPNQEESLLSEMRAMLELKKDSVRFAEMGNQSQKTSETKFSLSKMMTSLEAEYLEIFEKHSS